MQEVIVAGGEARASNWIWIGGAAIATFLIASVMPTRIVSLFGQSCLGVFQAFGDPGYACLIPFKVELDTGEGWVTLSFSLITKIVLALIAAGITAMALRRKPA